MDLANSSVNAEGAESLKIPQSAVYDINIIKKRKKKMSQPNPRSRAVTRMSSMSSIATGLERIVLIMSMVRESNSSRASGVGNSPLYS